MPELPEVETVKNGLNKFLPGLIVSKAESDWAKSFPNTPDEVKANLVGAKILTVRRRAKVLMVDLSSGYTLVTHLKMTGQLVFVRTDSSPRGHPRLDRGPSKKAKSISAWITSQAENDDDGVGEERFGAGHPNDSLIGRLPDKSTRVTLTFDDGSHLYFNDQRKFGWMRLVESQNVESLKFMQKLGPEPLEDDFTPEMFKERLLRRKNSGIKAVILDQTVLAGVGNIYADESLWGARIHPAKITNRLSGRQIYALYEELRFVLNLAIEKGGSTDRNYVNAEGKRGSYMDFARVFRREGQACPRCGDIIVKTRVASRGTHFCPTCQVK